VAETYRDTGLIGHRRMAEGYDVVSFFVSNSWPSVILRAKIRHDPHN
jgi:hypothetical protein